MSFYTSAYRSTRFSVKMILKNKQRTLTMALGIMIAIALVIGILGYIDYSQNEVITRAVQDISVDMTAFQSTPSFSQASDFNSYLAKYSPSSFISGYEYIEASSILGANSPGIVVPPSPSAILANTTSTSGFGTARFLNINGTSATVFGVNSSYFKTFSDIFRTENGSTPTLTSSSVFVSNTFADQTGYQQNDPINITIQELNIATSSGSQSFRDFNISTSLVAQKMFNITGIVDINSNIFQQSTDSFTASSSSSSSSQFGSFFASRLQRLTGVVIFMDINTFNTFVPSTAISFGAFQIKIDHSQLSQDTTLIGAQISQLQNYIQLQYPSFTIVSDLQNAISTQASQLDNLRLTLIYLTLPSIFIGFMLTKYATDLVLLERKKEITALRAKSLSQTQIRNYVVIESLISAMIGTL